MWILWLMLFIPAQVWADTDTRNPTGDEAVSGTWTGSAGTRYTVVDDHPDSGGTDELTHGTATAGNLTFTFTAFAVDSAASIQNVQVVYYDLKNGSPAADIAARLKIGGSYYAATGHNPANASRTLRTDTFTTNPATGSPWTPSEVNAIQAFGWVSADASPSIGLSSIQLVVNFSTGPPVGSMMMMGAGR